MVAINKTFLTLSVAILASLSAVAQQIQPRIAGLETNSNYMTLLTEDHYLVQREDSIAIVVESLREAYREDPANASNSREQIISCENQLFELRARKAIVVDSLNMIEQNWVINNMSASTTPSVASESSVELLSEVTNVKYIYESPNIGENLSNIDYRNLVKAEDLESKAEELSNKYVVNYDNMLSLRRGYETTQQLTEAEQIKYSFDSLARANNRILEELSDSWGFIYDNKSFAYSLSMELLGFTDILQQEAELMRKAQAEISSKQGTGGDDELMRYHVQKSSMVEFEILVAEKLMLTSVVDSLRVLSKRLASVDKNAPAKITIEERLFIDYQAVEFVSSPKYNTANPIPETEIYEKGVIFRIFVGSFQTKPAVSTFRNTIPVSHKVNELKRHCYYIGGFQTYEEAIEAQAKLKAHGFRAPKIVVWADGVERNLSSDPLLYSLETTYRVEILDTPSLPEGCNEAVGEAGAVISKIGTDKFVITSLTRSTQVDSLTTKLQALDSELKVVVEKNTPKIEF